MSSFIFALFLSIILFEKPITVTLKDGVFEYTVSPPPILIEYFFCSSFKDFKINCVAALWTQHELLAHRRIHPLVGHDWRQPFPHRGAGRHRRIRGRALGRALREARDS